MTLLENLTELRMTYRFDAETYSAVSGSVSCKAFPYTCVKPVLWFRTARTDNGNPLCLDATGDQYPRTRFREADVAVSCRI